MNDYYYTIKGQDPERGIYEVSFEGWDEIMGEILRLRKTIVNIDKAPEPQNPDINPVSKTDES